MLALEDHSVVSLYSYNHTKFYFSSPLDC